MSEETKIDELNAPVSTELLSEWLEWHKVRDRTITERKEIPCSAGIEEEVRFARADTNTLLYFVDRLIKAYDESATRQR